ncbi:hypothetical protein OZL92_19555 [Bacillus sonorensis]|uniref:Uncharacterized protein n=1 Tax=Bacillus sonorensis L12 TaxID=1274524 RepID=M5PEW5_9BACI|nr:MULTISPECIES: hypothetical protein [Bacillus]TWK72682.1 hypothetical protein CHCC20335_1347 [Bacillus paralicheniformis]EME75955.1 hypothetical protein BSONL12_03234 [Bacillus sonorensis L12]MCF7619516.1 hypothetical protein [Bacillus sonorensis]MCY7855879.1 hypothetical protein [Bacillus sonorensis]MCY8025516.1 hypothetical protein [Bacillus sonorensis]
MRGIQDEEGQAVKEWSIYLAVSIFFMACVTWMCFFNPAYRLADMLLRDV